MSRLLFPVALAAAALCGCPGESPRRVDTDVLSHLPRHEEQRQALCARGRDNAVTAVFCGPEAPALPSLEALQALLGLGFDPERPDDEQPRFALLGHSSSLQSRLVSSINPRAIQVQLPESDRVMNGDPGPRRSDGNIVALGYTRGDQTVELAVRGTDGDTAFYLLRYQQACTGDDMGHDGCTNAERFSSAAERDWLGYSLYDDVDLENSALDCLHCHEPDGPGTARIFRMQELENPWTHWMARFTLGGRVLFDDMVRAHGADDTIAGIPGPYLGRTDPIVVEDLVRFSDSPQPNAFPSPEVELEVQASAPGQPVDNSTPGQSASWQVVYDCAVRGDAIPPPHHDVKVTDPQALAAMTAAMIDHRAGGPSAFPDVTAVFSDAARVGMSHRVKEGADARAILVHACAQCHNPRLNPTLSRAQFNALDLDGLSDEQRVRIIDRLQRSDDDRYRMPPRAFRDLSAAEIEAVVAFLR